MNFKELFPGVYSIDGKLATRNFAKGKRVYDENLTEYEKEEYRSWTPYRSKLSAAIINGLKNFEIKGGDKVLYLGASTGTTASHVSDIVGENGRVYCVEISERSMRDLINVCQSRENMMPILANAHETDIYSEMIEECDAIYQDISAKEQAEILKKNSKMLKKGGLAYFVIKSQSIDISKQPSETFKSELDKLTDTFDIIERVKLEPFDAAHLFAVLKKK